MLSLLLLFFDLHNRLLGRRESHNFIADNQGLFVQFSYRVFLGFLLLALLNLYELVFEGIFILTGRRYYRGFSV